jgi:cytochrome c
MAAAREETAERRERRRMKTRPGVILGAAIVGSLLSVLSTRAQQPPSASAEFGRCAVCHSTDGSNGTGPTLRGIQGRRSGTVPGFRYSRAMRSANITWDTEALDRYLADPQELVPGNIMPFSGVPDGSERARIISYLISLR